MNVIAKSGLEVEMTLSASQVKKGRGDNNLERMCKFIRMAIFATEIKINCFTVTSLLLCHTFECFNNCMDKMLH